MQVITKTARLKLVEVTDRDVEPIFLLTGNKMVMKYFPKVLNGVTRKWFKKYIHQYSEYDYCFWRF